MSQLNAIESRKVATSSAKLVEFVVSNRTMSRIPAPPSFWYLRVGGIASAKVCVRRQAEKSSIDDILDCLRKAMLHARLPHTVRFLEAAAELLTHPVQGLRSRQIGGRSGGGRRASCRFRCATAGTRQHH